MVTEYELNSIPHLGRGCCKRRLRYIIGKNIYAKEGKLEKRTLHQPVCAMGYNRLGCHCGGDSSSVVIYTW